MGLGGVAYLLFYERPPGPLSRLLDAPALGPVLRSVRAGSVGLANAHLVLRSLPDLLWAFALGALLAGLWQGGPPRPRRVWMVLGGAMAVGYEIAQGLHVAPGTFDVRDLVAQALGYALGWIVVRPISASLSATPGASAASRTDR